MTLGLRVRRLVSIAMVCAVASIVVTPALAFSLSRQPCADVSVGHDCTRPVTITSCCCQVTPELPARAQDRTPTLPLTLSVIRVQDGVATLPELPISSRIAPRFGHVSIELFTLFSVFLL